jgi:hypothetical protein
VFMVLGAPQAPVSAPIPAAAGGVQVKPTKIGQLRKFPDVNASTGLPDIAGWEVAGLALQSVLRSVVSAEALVQFAALDASCEQSMPGWVDGCDDDHIIWDAMMNSGIGSLPDSLVTKLPGQLKRMRAGMSIYKHICKGVRTESDQSIGLLLAWFQRPEAVALSMKHLLSAVIQQWLNARLRLINGLAPQPDLVCRISLDCTIANLEEVKADVAAMKAASAASKAAVTIEMIVAVIQARANEYQSVAAQKKSVSAMAAFGAAPVKAPAPAPSPAPAPTPPSTPKGSGGYKSSNPCWNFKRKGGCNRGSKCRFVHDGKPGEPSKSRKRTRGKF